MPHNFQTRIGEERNYLSAGLVSAVRKADSKLVFIPVMFVLLRMWGTIQFVYTFIIPHTNSDTCTCIDGNFRGGLIFLGVMQVHNTLLLSCVVYTCTSW